MEEWRDIEGYEGFYQVSDSGQVRSLDRVTTNGRKRKGRTLKQANRPNGYRFVVLSKGNVPKECSVHRLVSNAFIPNPEHKPNVNHIDGNKNNNHVENLEWVTQSENNLHRYRVLGETCGGRPNKKVMCTTTGIVYASLSEAEKKTGVFAANISKTAKGKRNNAGGMKWVFVK